MTKQVITKEHMKMYKHKKLWMVMGITTTVLALGSVQAQSVHADTTTATTTSPTAVTVAKTTSTPTNTATLRTSTASGSTSGTTASATQASAATTSSASSVTQMSAVSQTGATSVASATTSTASATTSAATSAASTISSTVTSHAVTTSATAALQPASATSNANTMTSTTTSSATAPTSAATATNPTSASTTPTSTIASTVPSDATVVTIADSNLSAAVKQALRIAPTANLTIGDIRSFDDPLLSISVAAPIKTLSGIENLKYLPSTVLTELTFQIDNSALNIDLTPLSAIRLTTLSIESNYLSRVNLQPLTLINPNYFYLLELTPANPTYQGNQYAMTNAQLVQLGPWLTKVGNAGHNTYGDSVNIELSNNCLTDFSPLAGITNKLATIFAIGEVKVVTTNPVNLVIGQPAVFTGAPIIGLDGKPINDSYGYSWNTGTTGKKPIVSLGNNQYYISDVQPIAAGNPFLTYGHLGLAYSNGYQPGRYIDITYPDGVELRTDVMVFQVANWQVHPSVTVKYVDTKVQPITGLPDRVIDGTKIGENFDLTKAISVPGYLTVATHGAITGTFAQSPQVLYVMLRPATPAGAITGKAVDTAGNVLSTESAVYPDGEIVGLPYMTVPETLTGYTLKGLAPNSLAANGELTLAGGTVTYVYTKNVVLKGTVTVTYDDDTTGQVLTRQTSTGPRGTMVMDTTDQTIAAYERAGYDLVSDNVPTDTISYQATPLNYTVHLKHQVTTDQSQKQVKRTIHYVYADGKPAAADQVTTLQFTQLATTDLVTKVTTYTDWVAVTGQAIFIEQRSPVIQHYQADQPVVAAVNVTPVMPDMTTTVTYTAEATPTVPADDETTAVTAPKPVKASRPVVTKPTNKQQFKPTVVNASVDRPQFVQHNRLTTRTATTAVKTVIAKPAVVKSVVATRPALNHSQTVVTTKPQSATIKPIAVRTDALPLTKKAVTLTTSKSVKATEKQQAMPAKTALPQTNAKPNQAMNWFDLGVLLTTLLTAVGIRTRKHN